MSKKRKYSPRELMELAIEVMRKSVPEPRPDSKASPKVGAVLVKPDGAIETACRGELRHGDHAEFTLLERKNQDVNLHGCRKKAHARRKKEKCPPDALFAQCVVQKALEADNSVRCKGIW